ncbi:GMC family oxidoreductase [Demequina sp. SYSU T00039]|uniref:GMC family oxidoreductase n=1 Tax=Demequina lignilytica TaxID=3051663 RepID=A0AAW7M347_9MICO|nr:MULTISPECIES: GMC family oxidoreductase [unclassified Demequina]MDN4477933.1 GMC family oxidoreductase [Demequina sp. SYSU T00039-1]MDN4487842.1 GMC family oxidoreductase [Demequina sp. SYSU T00039]MDN4490775.1 GMC family oxidoreductase [Demequina sp. SYSU T00068]
MVNLDRRYDAIVIGSGPGGSSAVRELTERGLEVLLIDAGREVREEDFVPPSRKKGGVGLDLLPRANAMAHGRITQARRPYYSEGTNRFLVNDLEDPYTTPLTRPYLWIRGKLLGGRMHSYGRVLQRMSDVDFKAASADGEGQDWPIEYDDLKAWYDKVERSVGVYGDADGLVHPPDGEYVGPGYLTTVERDFKDRIEGRWPERKVISWRCQAPFPDRVPPGIAAARATGRLTILTESEVTRITTDDATGLATGVEFVNRASKREGRAFADAVVVTASTIESIRLLLNSGSSRHPNGLGNSSGLLGRYFMDQTISIGFFDSPQHRGVWERPDNMPADPFYGVGGGILIPRYENIPGHHDPSFLRGISFQGLGGRIPVPDGEPAVMGLGGAGEMLARYDNHVRLSRVKDRWGMPVPHIDISMGENDRLLLKRSMTALKEMGDEAGYRVNFIGSAAGLETKKIWPGFNPVQREIFRQGIKMSVVLGAAIHETGGARMGSDPSMSVVNGVNQLWDAPNVFVPDAASFVSGSNVGPALTIMALSARASGFIAEQHAAGGLTSPTEDVQYR